MIWKKFSGTLTGRRVRNREWWEYGIRAIVEEVDYDISKNLDPETSEEGEDAAYEMLDDLVRVARNAARHIEKKMKESPSSGVI